MWEREEGGTGIMGKFGKKELVLEGSEIRERIMWEVWKKNKNNRVAL